MAYRPRVVAQRQAVPAVLAEVPASVALHSELDTVPSMPLIVRLETPVEEL